MGQTGSILAYLFFTFFPDQLFSKLPAIDTDLTGRTYLVTGSNTGLGLAAEIHLARLKASRIVLAIRDLNKGAKAKEEIIAQTNFAGIIDVWELDMSKFNSVKGFMERTNGELKRLDGAIINAGIPNPLRRETTEDGWEKLLQVNAIATGLLSVLLLPLLQATAKLSQEAPHLTLTGSAAQFMARFSEKRATNILQTLNDPSQSNALSGDRYPTTKLFDLFLAREISKLPQAEGVVINVVDPGLCRSDITRDEKLGAVGMFFMRNIGWPTSKGAINLIWAQLTATPPGAFIGSCEIRQPPAWTTKKDGLLIQKKVWDEMVEVWKGVSPDVGNIIRLR
ncbi:hypothetical protein DFH08DRAFT_966783 [Mycena albidolilacea]|uniref:Short-chain dehydrogenase/reductase n=1 Tax=Mycena albidolilacea TaxID=1033008 RepID=A0AAD6ZNJ6_9AGAR|nr:hypothetical protein DFH08DRAFT_966783 [Mycena albidolilacea]